ncbi:alpha/beta fold hydrolase [Breoghania sp. JC706]|uniref:alpha/beta hydrolase n=1 Tax=Breoghania sp. JC706 TaxID=3117732 RepID=UPI0030084D91
MTPSEALRRTFAVVLVAMVAASCSTRPGPGSLKTSDAPEHGAQNHTILIATTRERASEPATYFNGERANRTNYAVATVSVPPSHKPGKIEWPAVPPGDPAKDFTLRSAGYLEGRQAFKAALEGELAKRKPADREAFVFVHGYNTRFSEALYRFTQVAHDSRARVVPILFTWASRGSVTDYVYDMNSAQIARDALEQTLRDIAATGVKRINILAHSMGAYLLAETFRQISISNNPIPADRFGFVALAAPDIDIDLFKQQLKRTGKPKKPFLILVSKDDKALKASSLLAGGKQRVGRYENTEELAALGAIVIDLTQISGENAVNHDKFAQIARIAPEIGETLLRARLGENAGAPSATGGKLGDIVGRGTNLVLTVPKTILSAPVQVLSGQ